MKMLSVAAHAASASFTTPDNRVSRSRLSELIAALLGYQTLAALQAEESALGLDRHLADADHYVLNVPLALTRAVGLGLAIETVDACINGLRQASTVPVYASVRDFYEEFARALIQEAIYFGECTAMAMAESNAEFPDEPELEDEFTESGSLWESREEWSIEVTGQLSGEYDPDGDRMYNGHEYEVWGKAIFAKAGRAGLVHLDTEEGASPVDDWRDDGYEE